jgi:hypothetical protein
MKTHKTSKGTELPISSIKGKDYLEVKYRLVWFREDHPDWSIETEFVSITLTSSMAKAVIKDDKGRIIATSHKFEDKVGFPDFIEKSETGAIGRALALLGYGTQFCADDLDEGKRLADSPGSKTRTIEKLKPSNFDDKVYIDATKKQAAESMALNASKPVSEPQTNVQPPQGALPEKGPSEAQIKRLWAIAGRMKYDQVFVKEKMQEMYKKDSASKLTWLEYSDFTKKMEIGFR